MSAVGKVFTSFTSGLGWPQLIVLLIGLAILWYFYLTKEYRRWEGKGLYSVKPELIFGNLRKVYLMQQHMMEQQKEYYQNMKGHK